MPVRLVTPSRDITLTLTDVETNTDYTEEFLDNMNLTSLVKSKLEKDYLSELGVDSVYVCDEETARYWESVIRDLQLASDTIRRLTLEQRKKAFAVLGLYGDQKVESAASCIFAAISEALKP